MRIGTKSLISGLIIITAEDEAHAKIKAVTHHDATGVLSVLEVNNGCKENETENHEAGS